MKKFIYIVFCFNSLFITACKHQESSSEDIAVEESISVSEIVLPEPEANYESDKMAAYDAPPTEEPVNASPGNVQEEASYAKKIIKSATIRYEVTDLEKEKQHLVANINQLKGIVVSEVSDASIQNPQISFELNIPSEKFDSFISSLEKSVDYFEMKEIKRLDITRDYVDVESRLKNQRALEKRYLDLLQQAKNVTEILEIESNLNNVRLEIEIAENRLKLYDRQVSYSQVSLTIFKEMPYAKSPDRTFGNKTKNAFVGGFENFVNSLIDILYLWPFFLIILIISIWLFVKYRKYKKKHP